METNAPDWIERLVDEQTVAQRLTQQAEYVVSSPDEARADAVLPILEELAARLLALKTYEESPEFLPSLKKSLPGQAAAIDRLLHEHVAVEGQAREITAAVQGLAHRESLDRHLIGRVQLWLSHLREHQQHVERIVREALAR